MKSWLQPNHPTAAYGHGRFGARGCDENLELLCSWCWSSQGKAAQVLTRRHLQALQLLWLDFGKEKLPVLGCGAVLWKRQT